MQVARTRCNFEMFGSTPDSAIEKKQGKTKTKLIMRLGQMRSPKVQRRSPCYLKAPLSPVIAGSEACRMKSDRCTSPFLALGSGRRAMRTLRKARDEEGDETRQVGSSHCAWTCPYGISLRSVSPNVQNDNIEVVRHWGEISCHVGPTLGNEYQCTVNGPASIYNGEDCELNCCYGSLRDSR
jgi:hypothetical protein